MRLEYKSPEVKGNDNDGLYIENLVFNMGYDSLRVIWPCEDERFITKYESNGFEIRGTVKNGIGRRIPDYSKCKTRLRIC